MKITSVAINGMHNVSSKTYEFTNLNYLYGPNGAGKSTILQAIQLGLLGYIPGTSKASKESIFRHANGPVLSVVLKLDDDGSPVTITRTWAGTKSNIQSTCTIDPADYDISQVIKELELPIFNFNEFIGMTANKLKDWFIDFLPSAEVSIDWKKTLTDDARAAGFDTSDTTFIDSVVSEIAGMQETGSDLIRAVNDKFKTALSFKKKELERAQSTIQSLIYYDDIDETMTEEEVATKIAEYEMRKEVKDSVTKSLSDNAKIEAQLKAYEDCESESAEVDPRYIKASKDYASASDKILKAQNDIIKHQSDSLEIQTKMNSLVDDKAKILADNEFKQTIVHSEGVCPLTHTDCASIKSLISEYKDQITKNNDEINRLTKEIAECKEAIDSKHESVKSLNDLIATLTQSKYDYNKIMSDVQSNYAKKEELSKQIVVVPEIEDSDIDYDACIKELREIQIKHAANKKYNDLIDTLTKEKFKIDQEIVAYKSWINLTGVNGLQNDASAIKPFIDLQTDMDTYIQAVFGKGVCAKFNLENKANSFSFGIMRYDEYIPFNLLSSGEKCLYTLALMLCLTQLADSSLKVVLVDDLLDHLDDVNIDKLFQSLKSVTDIQMIFAGVKHAEGDFIIEVTD